MCRACQQYKKEYSKVQDVRNGAVEADDFEKEVNYRPKKKVKSRSRAPGCAGNDGGKHIYVWTSEGQMEDLFFMYFKFHKHEQKLCAGCMKRDSGTRSRYTERYVKKFKPTGRWDSPERKHPGYKAFREQWLIQRGYTPEWYGWLF
jgi:hypothetical protein